MTSLAGKVANNIGQSLNLIGNGSTDAWQGNANDPYEIAELVAELSGDVTGSPAEAGELTRALHSFVQESAALFGARPESESLKKLQTAIGAVSSNGGTATFAALTQRVESATQAILEAA
jgi:hypothetical protein